MSAGRPRGSGREELSWRLAALWPLKLMGIPAAIAGFFAFYFLLLEHPLFPVRQMPLTIVDRWIAFRPEALGLYASLWVYACAAPCLLGSRAELAAFCRGVALICAAGFGVFLFWPTAVPRPDIDWARYPAFGTLKSLDQAGNASPSLHVAFAIFSALWLDCLARKLDGRTWLRWANRLWCAGIVYSTVATRQHVAIDVYLGAVLGWVAAAVSLRQFDALPDEPLGAPHAAARKEARRRGPRRA